MKKLLILAICFNTPLIAYANCTGTETNYSCYDYNTGNSYLVNKIGNQTHVSGSNAKTGSRWSQHSQTIGNITYQNGIRADGSNWNQTIQHNGAFGNSYNTQPQYTPQHTITPVNNAPLYANGSAIDIEGIANSYQQGKALKQTWKTKRRHKKAMKAYRKIDWESTTDIENFLNEYPEEVEMGNSLIDAYINLMGKK